MPTFSCVHEISQEREHQDACRKKGMRGIPLAKHASNKHHTIEWRKQGAWTEPVEIKS